MSASVDSRHIYLLLRLGHQTYLPIPDGRSAGKSIIPQYLRRTSFGTTLWGLHPYCKATRLRNQAKYVNPLANGGVLLFDRASR